jgi:L-2-amino-thiazoline-4-carboxylic acid hydrolase
MSDTSQNDSEQYPREPHRFDQPLPQPLTYRERTELAYLAHFIPYLKFLEQSVGREQVIQSLQDLVYPGVKAYADDIVKTSGKNDLSVIKEIYSPANPGLCEVLTMQVIEDTEDTYVVNVTECLLAEVFRKAGAADFGYAYLCCDGLLTQLINPRIGLDLDGTIMQGKSCCLHRWYVRR